MYLKKGLAELINLTTRSFGLVMLYNQHAIRGYKYEEQVQLSIRIAFAIQSGLGER